MYGRSQQLPPSHPAGAQGRPGSPVHRAAVQCSHCSGLRHLNGQRAHAGRASSRSSEHSGRDSYFPYICTQQHLLVHAHASARAHTHITSTDTRTLTRTSKPHILPYAYASTQAAESAAATHKPLKAVEHLPRLLVSMRPKGSDQRPLGRRCCVPST
jgi:hypothetical protein